MKYFAWVEGVRVGKDDIVRFGYYALAPDGKAESCYWLYSAAKNLPGYAMSVKYPGFDVPIRRPQYTFNNSDGFPGTWAQNDGILTVKIGSVPHIWEVKDNGIFEQNNWSGSSFCGGFGCYVENIRSHQPLIMWDFSQAYDGEWFGTVNGQWRDRIPSGFNPYLFSVGHDSSLWIESHVDPSDNLKVFSAVALNQAPFSTSIFYNSGGHDFNHNDKPDDFGHTSIAWALRGEGGMVSTILKAECSWQTNGKSIMGFGYYQ